LVFGSEVDQGTEFLLISSSEQDAVEFDLLKSGGECGSEPFQEIVEGSSGDLAVQICMQGIQAEVDGLDSGFTEFDGQGGEESSVGGQG